MDNVELVKTIGAGYGALQALAQFIMLIASKNTWAWKFAKFLVAGDSRPPPDTSLGGVG